MNRSLVVTLIMIVIAGVIWVAYAPVVDSKDIPYPEKVRVDNDTLPPTFPDSREWRGAYKVRKALGKMDYEWDEPYQVLFGQLPSYEKAREIGLGIHESDDMPLWDSTMVVFVNEAPCDGALLYIYYIEE